MAQDELIGRKLGQYEITGYIARGGMAVVYKARQESIGRTVAVKVIDPEFARDPTLMQRFKREVQLIVKLEHPRILPVYDYGEVDGRPYIVMAYLAGGSVSDLIAGSEFLSVDRVSKVMDQVAEGLNHAHKEGVIHRDLKPSNILLDKEGNAHLADFGIAKLLTEDSQQLTGDKVIGTLSYMAPEMFRRETLTTAIDIYAMGVMLYQMLARALPYEGDTAQIIGMHLHEPVPDVRRVRSDLAPDISRVISTAMAKDPVSRYPDPLSMAAALKEVITGTAGTRQTPKAQRGGVAETFIENPTPQDASWGTEPVGSTPGQPSVAATLQEPVYVPPSKPSMAATMQEQAVYAPPPQQPVYAAPPAVQPAPRREERRRGGLSLPLLLGIAAVLVIGLVVCGVGGYAYFFGPNAGNGLGSGTGSNPGGSGNVPVVTSGVAQVTEEPATQEPPYSGGQASTPRPAVTTAAPASATPPIDDAPAIEESVLDFDEQMRYILETGDTTQMASAAADNALEGRLSAASILKDAGNCHWQYNHRGLDVLDIERMTDRRAKVTANVDRDGTVMCDDGERPQYAFTGPYTAIYISEYRDNKWIVIDYCAYEQCPEEYKN